MITPTTKAEDHDVPISPAEIVAQGLMSQVGVVRRQRAWGTRQGLGAHAAQAAPRLGGKGPGEMAAGGPSGWVPKPGRAPHTLANPLTHALPLLRHRALRRRTGTP